MPAHPDHIIDLRSLGHLVHELRFTIVTLVALIIAAMLTDTQLAPITAATIRRLGFAPRDLWELALWRAFTSALVTNGGPTFALALLSVAVFVGTAELRTSSATAALVFWGGHLATLLIESLLVALPLHLSGIALGTALAEARDVGPSAGYFACLGLAIGTFAPRARRWLAIAVSGALIFMVVSTSGSLSWMALELSASVAHLIAFPLGYAGACLRRRKRARR